MIINHPLLGPRDSSEFTYRGDAVLLNRPDPKSESLLNDYYEYQYIRNNRHGFMKELWFHEQGDRSWLVVTRNTVTHEIIKVELASEYKRENK